MAGPSSGLTVLHVTNMWPEPKAPHFGAFVESQVESLRRRGVRCEVVYARRNYLELRRGARQAIDRDEFDLVHAHFGYTGAAIADVCARRRKPLLISYCGGDLNGEEGGNARRLKAFAGSVISRLAGAFATNVIVKTPQMHEHLPEWLRRKSVVLPNGVDIACFSPRGREAARAALGWGGGTIILFGGRREDPTKNFALAKAAVDELIARGLQARLIPLEGVPHDRVADWLNAADVVLLTSLREGSPNIVKEAMACGARVVAVHVGDVPWLLEGVQGARVTPYDPRAVADAIVAVLGSSRGGGRDRIQELSLDSDSVAMRLENLYRIIAAGRGA
jgi:glycosyltransferase involved in cell wall biosynthesis